MIIQKPVTSAFQAWDPFGFDAHYSRNPGQGDPDDWNLASPYTAMNPQLFW